MDSCAFQVVAPPTGSGRLHGRPLSHVGSVCGPCPFSRERTHGTHICLGGAFGRRKPAPLPSDQRPGSPHPLVADRKKTDPYLWNGKKVDPLTGRPSTQRGSSRIEEGETTEGRALCDWQAPEGFPDYLRR